MTYAIIGSGAIGSALARQFARKGIDVLIANSRGPESLARLEKELGKNILPVSVEEATRADIVILAVPFKAVPDVVGSVASWGGKIVVDATNAINFSNFKPSDLGGRLSSEVVADAVPGAQVVKAFNTLPAALLASVPEMDGGRRVLFLSGNNARANAEVAGLIQQLGFAPIELGKLADGGRLQQFGGPLMVHNLLKRD
ncbi:NADPH-dependent F420 reductase [Archangium violaceum]|uniref:NADPH-dependent F420 reductase n=1 Tax=Archangium violaceum TaxID=83451 RepID=UPI00193C7A50|nr:NADPH-dependent F420 reductase [Archangium violaceum]QRK11333.1 NADPH-dependent F420 reductase [Archangium violaceum]